MDLAWGWVFFRHGGNLFGLFAKKTRSHYHGKQNEPNTTASKKIEQWRWMR